jgi:two-component system sensor histidine kinase DesK
VWVPHPEKVTAVTTQKTDARRDERFPSALVAFAASWFVVALFTYFALTTVFDHREIIGYGLAALSASIVVFVAGVMVLAQRMFVYGRVDPRLTVAAWIAIPLGMVVVPISEVWEMCGMSVAISSTLVRGRWAPAVVGRIFVIATVVTFDVDRADPLQAFIITLFTLGVTIVLSHSPNLLAHSTHCMHHVNRLPDCSSTLSAIGFRGICMTSSAALW